MIKNNFTKKDFTKIISNESGFSKLFSKKIVNDIVDVIRLLIKDNNLIIKNFGSFKLREKSERKGRNPKTKESFLIQKRKSVSFYSSKNITNLLNFDK